MTKAKNTKQDNLTEIESALTKTEQFIERNQKILSIVAGAIILIAAGFIGFKNFYIEPKEKSAQEQMFMAEFYFEKDSFNLAINGDGNYLGFLDIIEDYGLTKSAKLAKYYTGISYLHLGEYKEALAYLSSFKTKDMNLAPTLEGAKGDAYAELGQNDKALSAYKKAAAYDNKFTAPNYLLKIGKLLEETQKYDEALKIFQEIKDKYPQSMETNSAERYIGKIETLKSK